MTDRQRYYDSLMVRGWLVPERALIEAQTAGSRADSETQSANAMSGSEAIDHDLARQLNWYVIDPLLVYNFGERARGSVYITPAPIEDDKRRVFSRLFEAVLTNPGTLEETLTWVDMDAVFDVLEIPKRNGTVVDFGSGNVTPPNGEPLTPEQEAKMTQTVGTPAPAETNDDE
jgi:hypothetical protein